MRRFRSRQVDFVRMQGPTTVLFLARTIAAAVTRYRTQVTTCSQSGSISQYEAQRKKFSPRIRVDSACYWFGAAGGAGAGAGAGDASGTVFIFGSFVGLGGFGRFT